MKLGAVVAAAGEGLRMKNDTRKQYLLLEGVPVLARSVMLFLNHPAAERVVVVVPPGEAERVSALLEPYCPPGRIMLTEGGPTRQESVWRGLQAVAGDCAIIGIHDAARPLASEALLRRLIEAALTHGAAAPVIELHDTVKEVSAELAELMIAGTLSRACLRLAQTPQLFRQELIRRAHSVARQKGILATDDAALVELLGEPVAAVEGEAANLKITAPVDLALASWYLKEA